MKYIVIAIGPLLALFALTQLGTEAGRYLAAAGVAWSLSGLLTTLAQDF